MVFSSVFSSMSGNILVYLSTNVAFVVNGRKEVKKDIYSASNISLNTFGCHTF